MAFTRAVFFMFGKGIWMMGRPRWPLVLSLLLAVALGGRTATAQAPGGPMYAAPSPAGVPYGAPGHAPPPMGGAMPPPVGAGYHQLPPEFAPWPGISPYDNRFQQHLHTNGLWINETSNVPQRYFFTLESLVSRTKAPEENLVGSLGVPAYPGNLFPIIDLGAFTTPGTVGSPLVVPMVVGQQQEHDPTSPGIRGVWGFENPDGSGLELSAYWASDVNFLFQRGFDTATEFDPTSLRVTAGLPLDNGMGGSTVPYDKYFRITFDSETFEARLLWLITHRWHLRSLHIQPEWGLRYMYVRERFTFDGADSGLAIGFLPDGNPDLTNPPVVVPGVSPYESSLRSGVRSHLAGPQIGLRYQMGGDIIQLEGASRFGLLANRERLTLEGFGIGDGFDPANFFQDSVFSETQVHTHVSPLLEQSFNADFKVFGIIPVLRRLHVLEDARLRVGYSITGIWEMARPSSSIVWQGLPLYPRIRVDREKWYIQSWHFGIHWQY